MPDRRVDSTPRWAVAVAIALIFVTSILLFGGFVVAIIVGYGTLGYTMMVSGAVCFLAYWVLFVYYGTKNVIADRKAHSQKEG